MTYREIFSDVAHRCDKQQNPDPLTRSRLNTFINDRYRELMRLPGTINYRDESFPFASVANQPRYVLPVTIGPVVSITDSTNRRTLARRTLAWIRQQDPSVPPSAFGTPWAWAPLNSAGVATQPTVITTNALEVVSSSATDTAVVDIEYQDDAGGFRVIAVTLNGLTPVTVAATVINVFRITYLTTAVGTITLRQIVAGTVIATLPPTSLVSNTNNPHAGRALVVQLWPTPAGVYAYTIDGSRPRAALVEDMDEPTIPEDFHTLLVWGACWDEMLKMDDDRADKYEKLWVTDLKAFRAYLNGARGDRIIPEGGRPDRRANWTPMGGPYPPWQ